MDFNSSDWLRSFDAAVGATDAGWRVALARAVDVTDARLTRSPWLCENSALANLSESVAPRRIGPQAHDFLARDSSCVSPHKSIWRD